MRWAKYLADRAMRAPIEPTPTGSCRMAIVIPVYAEDEELAATVASLLPQLSGVLVVLVVNHPPGAPLAALECNRRIISAAKRRGIAVIAAGELRDGVGEARKIGMDSVLPYLSADGIICSLDADSPVADNYVKAVLQAMDDCPGCAGGVVSFRHQESDDDRLNAAIVDYEIWLRYYVAALKYCGSPYAFFTIGSTMVTRADSYVKAGGMRRRAAGEDFYFLQALRKIAPIVNINTTTTTVYPSSRVSTRVPFGTGRRVGGIVAGREIKLYHPDIFRRLRELYRSLNGCADLVALPGHFAVTLPVEVIEFLEQYNFRQQWQKICRNTPPQRSAQLQAFHVWFDAFRTLKFVHFCERHYQERFEPVALAEAVHSLFPEISGYVSHATILEWLRDKT